MYFFIEFMYVFNESLKLLNLKFDKKAFSRYSLICWSFENVYSDEYLYNYTITSNKYIR